MKRKKKRENKYTLTVYVRQGSKKINAFAIVPCRRSTNNFFAELACLLNLRDIPRAGTWGQNEFLKAKILQNIVLELRSGKD